MRATPCFPNSTQILLYTLRAAAPGTAFNVTIALSCRAEDVGKPKAEVAAKRVMERVPGVTVTVHVGKIQDKSQDFYEEFSLYILGLDSIEARRYMNGVACSFLGKCPCMPASWQHLA